jgi:hypothetical protein
VKVKLHVFLHTSADVATNLQAWLSGSVTTAGRVKRLITGFLVACGKWTVKVTINIPWTSVMFQACFRLHACKAL